MNCPRCKAAPLATTRRLEVDVDECASCHGMWLDAGEGEQLSRPDQLPSEVIAELKSLIETHTPVKDESAALNCPRCEQTMIREHYAQSHVEIDTCRCGTWLDEGELDKITAHRIKCLDELSKRHEGDDDFSFGSQVLEQTFARLYFEGSKAE